MGDVMNIQKQQFVTVIKTAIQAAKELGSKVDHNKFKVFVSEVNNLAFTVKPFDREAEQQLSALNQFAQKLGISKPSKSVRSSNG